MSPPWEAIVDAAKKNRGRVFVDVDIVICIDGLHAKIYAAPYKEVFAFRGYLLTAVYSVVGRRFDFIFLGFQPSTAPVLAPLKSC